LATLALATSGLAGFGKKSKSIGLQLYSVRDEIKQGLDLVFERLAALGYKHVEMYGYYNGSYFGNDMAATAALLKKHGLSAPSAHVGIADFLYKSNDDPWKKAVEDGARLGNKYLVVPWLDEPHRKSADDYKKIAARLNRAAEICRQGGLRFAYHNHAFEFDDFGGTTGYDILLKETDATQVKMELDLYWVANAGKDAVELFRQYPGRFVMWHVKDMHKADKNKQTELGKGAIDFPALFKHAKHAGLEYPFVEQENYSVSPFESMKENIAYMRNTLMPLL
jgi:sugar phosphate isomerase/epimerase